MESKSLSDGELLKLLDDSNGVWVVRTGLHGPVGTRSSTLREALTQAHELSNKSISPLSIVRLGDDIRISNDQIFELWKQIGLIRSLPK